MSSASERDFATIEATLKWIGSNKKLGNVTLQVNSRTQSFYIFPAMRLQREVSKLIATAPFFGSVCIYNADHAALTLRPRFALQYTDFYQGTSGLQVETSNALAKQAQAWSALVEHARDAGTGSLPVVLYVTQYSNKLDAVSAALLQQRLN